ncbi:hypothetical protein Lepto7375DRAFT_7856 [Leptolyngbya sp. PCC 7375]|nr:hypothetical protein Lepto7375DRAFT_7856 [Leptolyngbya sp. PCC 7375]
MTVVLTICVQPVFAVNPTPDYPDISTLRTHILTLDDLEARTVIAPTVSNAQRQFYADQASNIRGETTTVNDLRHWNQFKAIFRIQVIVRVLAVVVSVLGAGLLCFGVIKRLFQILSGLVLTIVLTIVDFLKKIPIVVYKVFFCGVGVALMVFLKGLTPNFLGAVIFFLSLGLLHGKDTWKIFLQEFEDDIKFVSGTCCAVYAGAAWWNQSITLGVLASLAFVACFGFILLAGPLTIIIGFDSTDKAGQGTFAAACLILFGLGLTQHYLPRSLDVFQTGALFTGTFVYFVGMLILSSKWVAKEKYWLRNVVTCLSGPLLIAVATSLDLGVVNAIAGTFFVIFLMDKYVEFCTLWVKNTIGFGAALLGTGLLGFGLMKILESPILYG